MILLQTLFPCAWYVWVHSKDKENTTVLCQGDLMMNIKNTLHKMAEQGLIAKNYYKAKCYS